MAVRRESAVASKAIVSARCSIAMSCCAVSKGTCRTLAFRHSQWVSTMHNPITCHGAEPGPCTVVDGSKHSYGRAMLVGRPAGIPWALPTCSESAMGVMVSTAIAAQYELTGG